MRMMVDIHKIHQTTSTKLSLRCRLSWELPQIVANRWLVTRQWRSRSQRSQVTFAAVVESLAVAAAASAVVAGLGTPVSALKYYRHWLRHDWWVLLDKKKVHKCQLLFCVATFDDGENKEKRMLGPARCSHVAVLILDVRSAARWPKTKPALSVSSLSLSVSLPLFPSFLPFWRAPQPKSTKKWLQPDTYLWAQLFAHWNLCVCVIECVVLVNTCSKAPPNTWIFIQWSTSCLCIDTSLCIWI